MNVMKSVVVRASLVMKVSKKMTYRTVEEYLNEEFRKPIKHYLKNTPKKTQEKVMEVVDYLCDKYRQAGGTAKYLEENGTVGDYLEWQAFMDEKGYLRPINYDSLDDVFSEEEMETMLGEEDA